jgi:hypothetical protein
LSDSNPEGNGLREGSQIEAEINTFDVVVMSQSCDLAHGKLELIMLCPFFPLEKWSETNKDFASKKQRDRLRQGMVHPSHLLNRCDITDFESDLLVVDFKAVYSAHSKFLTAFVPTLGPRRRLLPPYREHLSQAFARFLMRVGLPVDIPSFS